MIREGLKNLAAGANPMVMKKGIKKAAAAAVESIKEISQPVSGSKDVARVGAISSGDEVIGTLIAEAMEKVSKILREAYEDRDEAWPGKMKYRAIVWSCPAHYYANFSNWAANCWGIDVLVEMESLNFTKPLETEDKEEALRDLGRLYERMVMRRHTNGGYQNVVDELWKQCEDWNAPLIIMYQNVACKNMATVQGILDEQGRARGYDLIWVEHDLMDPRTVSRRTR